MSTLFSLMGITLDGFHEGPNHEFDWPNVDAEFDEFAQRQLDDVDVLVFGRRTYEGMADFWPTDAGRAEDPVVAERMNETSKIVFSRSLDVAGWNNTRLVQGDAAEELSELKRDARNNLAILGSSTLTASLLPTGLIDELRVMVNPVLLGDGASLFAGLRDRVHLTHLATRTFESGNVLLTYRPEVAP